MPKITIHNCNVVDVQMSINPKENGQDKTLVINIDEEDLFEMFDKLNQKNIKKYLHMRKISFVDNISIKKIEEANSMINDIRWKLQQITSSN